MAKGDDTVSDRDLFRRKWGVARSANVRFSKLLLVYFKEFQISTK